MTERGSPTADGTADEALLHFLYQLPVAVLRIERRGEIGLLNPRAASLLQSLGLQVAGAGAGSALLHALNESTAQAAWAAADTLGTVVSRQAALMTDVHGQARTLALTVQVVQRGSWMVTLEDVTELQAALEAQRASERRYRDLIEVIPAGVVLHGPASEILAANAEASRILGLSPAQLMGRDAIDPYWQFQHEDGRVMTFSEYPVNQVLRTGEAVSDLVVGIRQPGKAQLVWVIVNAIPVRAETGGLREVCVSFTEITPLKEAERRLRESEERYRLVLKGANDAPWDWDLQRRVIYYSPRWWEIVGWPEQTGLTDPDFWVSILHPEDRDRVSSMMRRCIVEGPDSFEAEFRFVDPQGVPVDVLARGFVLRDEQGTAIRVSGTTLDLRERKRAAAEIQRLAYSDPLTGLPNRRRLIEKLREALSASGRTQWHGALFFIDLDRFKELNDTRGHDSGDELLQQVAERLQSCTRDTDLVARLGGDEFVVLVEHLSEHLADAAVDAERVGQKILEVMAEPFELRSGAHHGAASVGVVLFGPAAQSVEQLLKHADLAMYRAKALGGERLHFFDDGMQASMEQRVAMEADLRGALRQGQLQVHYQAQVWVGEGVRGVEALVRWHHPDRGWTSPGVFIPLAETTGLILPIGRWVLEQVCQQIVAWAQDPLTEPLVVAANVSVHQIHDAGFVQEVERVLASTGANPRRLKLELTESALAQDIDQVIQKMKAIRALGVTWSLDDFGTGYSSLSYLKRLPLDQLKIDGSFVRDVITDPGDATLVRTIVGLTREFGIEVIAEGVETDAQRDFLLNAGCSLFQGYLFGRPEPGADVVKRLPLLNALRR